MQLKKLILLFILLFSININAQTSVVLELQQKLSNINTMQASFSQRVYSEQKTLLQTYNGNMQFKRPHQFRWQVEQPDASLLITDGKKLWNYDVGLEQVTIQKFTANKEITPLSFVLDDSSNLPKNFNVEPVPQDCYKLTPVHENQSFVNVAVCFKNGLIKSVEILDHLGQNSVFEFYQVKNNISILDKSFAFKPPAGVDVVGEP